MLFPRSRSTRGGSLPLFLLFPPVFVAVYLLHITLLRLPYYWDEGGYYIPAAWDFWRVGTLIPQTTMSNAHPPLPSVLLAGWWGLTGFHIYSTRLFLCLVTSLALLAVFRMARVLLGEAAAFAVTILTAIYPVWFAQSTLAHADMFAAAAALWALSFYVDRPGWRMAAQANANAGEQGKPVVQAVSVAVCFSLAALCKETAIVTPAALFCLEGFFYLRQYGGLPKELQRPYSEATRASTVPMLIATAVPVLPLLCWYAYHHAKTGFTFGNPEYLRYNATANISAARIALSLWHRLIHLTVHLNLFVALLATLAVSTLPILRGARRLPQGAKAALGTVLVVHWVCFSVLGGALLTRYLLPAYPVLLLLCVYTWQRRTWKWPAIAALTLAGFALACVVNPPYPFAPEDNLAYRDMIVLQQQAIQQVESRYPGATVLSAWPVTADLQRPELGYVPHSVRTAQIQNFTSEEVAKAAQTPGDYDTAIVFSTKYNPPLGGLNLKTGASAADSYFFDAHRDMLPKAVARALGGDVVWQAERKGQWAAVLHFHRTYNAQNSVAPTF